MDSLGAGQGVAAALEGWRCAATVEERLAGVGGGLTLDGNGSLGILGGVGYGGLAWAGGEPCVGEGGLLEAGVYDLGGVEEAEACGVHGGAADRLGVDEAFVGAEGLHRLAHDIVVLGFLSAGAAGADLVLQGDKLFGGVGFIASLHADACSECAEGAGYGCAGGVKLGSLLRLLACLAVLLGGDEGVDLGVDEFIQADVGGLDGNIRSHAYGCSRAEGSADKLRGFGSALLGADEVGGVSQARDRDRSRGEDRDELAGGVVAGGELVRGVEAIQ